MNDCTLKKLQAIELEIFDEFVRICDKYNLQYCLIAGALIGAVRHGGFIPWDDDIDVAMPRKDYNEFLKICSTELNKDYKVDSIQNNENYWLPMIKLRKVNTIYEESIMKNTDYNGPKGVWIDVLPLDNATEKGIFQLLRSRIVKETRIWAGLNNNFENPKKLKKIRKFFASFFSNKSLLKFQTYIMTLNKKEDSRCYINFASKYKHKKYIIPKDKYFPAKKMLFEGKEYNVPNDYDYVLKKVYGNYMEMPPIDQQENHGIGILIVKNDKEL